MVQDFKIPQHTTPDTLCPLGLVAVKPVLNMSLSEQDRAFHPVILMFVYPAFRSVSLLAPDAVQDRAHKAVRTAKALRIFGT